MGNWWRSAVFYEVYVRSFADGSGDGVGDLPGIRSRLGYLRDLGVDALWLTPFYPSPMADHGYDVADPRDVDPLFGTIADFDALLRDAHDLGLRVTIDIVPNHVSDRHRWFADALAAGPGSPERERFLFRDGRGPGGDEPPNNWQSTFGGPAWTRVPDGQWYLHLFAPGQPDLNWRHPEVGDDYERTLRFWLDRGVDGFRIDVAHGLFKAPDLPDLEGESPNLMADVAEDTGMWNQPEVHDVYRRWRSVLDEYPHEPAMVGEVWMGDPAVVRRYVRPDELHMAFNFRLLFSDWDPGVLREVVDRSLESFAEVGAPATWVLSNHDVERHVTRYGGGQRGRRRARAALLMLLALPGPAFLYNGEELGLEDAALPDELLQDPIWERSGRTVRGRDGCRVPLPWSGTHPPFGFSPDGAGTWLPQPAGWAALTVERQLADSSSMLALYRRVLALRHQHQALGEGSMRWLPSDPDVLCFERAGAEPVRCLVNMSTRPVALPSGAQLLCASDDVDGVVPPDIAVWLLG